MLLHADIIELRRGDDPVLVLLISFFFRELGGALFFMAFVGRVVQGPDLLLGRAAVGLLFTHVLLAGGDLRHARPRCRRAASGATDAAGARRWRFAEL